MSDRPDEFEWIRRGLAPLAKNAPEAFDLADDAAAIAGRQGFDLIVSNDAIVEGVHFLADDPPELVARKLLRVNLSDLAAKGAEPYGYFLAVAWPDRFGWPEREAFARGLEADQTRYGLKLLGGDTVATPGPLTASVTILGWAPAGRMVQRAGAEPGDVVLATGVIGDGWLGLEAARQTLVGISYEYTRWLANRYRLPEPRLGLGDALRACAHAAADISDGLIADASKVAAASGLGLQIDLDALPLSDAAKVWLATASDPVAARLALASGGDDYELVITAPKANVEALRGACGARGLALTAIGGITARDGVRVLAGGREIEAGAGGWVHG